MNEKQDTLAGRTKVVLVAVLLLSVGIYFWGAVDSDLDAEPNAQEDSSLRPETGGGPPEVEAYGALRDSPMYAAIRSWIEDEQRLQRNTPGYQDAVNNETASKSEALARRAENRAFNGAPPTVPHPVIQTGFPDCLVCHQKGLRIRGRVASAMSHRVMHNCTQCHTTSQRQDPAMEPFLADDNISWENDFEGRRAPLEGPRAFSIGPPQIPHTTLMRENCDACHGLNGQTAIRTSHPARFNCQQCHVGRAAEDQQARLDLESVIK